MFSDSPLSPMDPIDSELEWTFRYGYRADLVDSPAARFGVWALRGCARTEGDAVPVARGNAKSTRGKQLK
jgi:hypothetical protein